MKRGGRRSTLSIAWKRLALPFVSTLQLEYYVRNSNSAGGDCLNFPESSKQTGTVPRLRDGFARVS